MTEYKSHRYITGFADRERDTSIAALRFWRRKGWDRGAAGPEWGIAVNDRGGGDAALTTEEIDELIEGGVDAVLKTFVVSFLDPFSGFRLAGPFADYDDALDHGESARADDEEFRIVEVQQPEAKL
jgi:hypothetical protein